MSVNEDLLDTPVVRGSVSYWAREGLSFKEIKDKLVDIHLIIVDDWVLEKFFNKLGIKLLPKKTTTKTKDLNSHIHMNMNKKENGDTK